MTGISQRLRSSSLNQNQALGLTLVKERRNTALHFSKPLKVRGENIWSLSEPNTLLTWDQYWHRSKNLVVKPVKLRQCHEVPQIVTQVTTIQFPLGTGIQGYQWPRVHIVALLTLIETKIAYLEVDGLPLLNLKKTQPLKCTGFSHPLIQIKHFWGELKMTFILSGPL